MRLERLEINGFKSFSDRSELAFDKGVTAIVGPNGCGKSNVADAITWVMGEQSAKSLRGDRMEDVLFSGSDARKPTASAEVRLRFSGVLKNISGPPLPVVGGDAAAACIAAASVLAKVSRDRLMVKMETEHPGYGFAEHKGYSTPAHSAALAELGPCSQHRYSFINVRRLVAVEGELVPDDALDSEPEQQSQLG